jgi:4-amino-4-deoxy-L-arabinose transferase-like glycosyltransferase
MSLETETERATASEPVTPVEETPPAGRRRAASSGAGRPAPGRAGWGMVALVGLIAFGVYARTAGISIAWGDSPELTAAAANAGVPHPTGYPLYMILGHAFIRLVPFGSVALKMNLLSAIFAALAVALSYRLMVQITRSRAASVMTALAFAFSLTFWSQAVIAEVYALHMLGMTAVLTLVLTWDQRGDRRWLLAAAVTYGLCFTHHLLSVLLAPGLLLFALTSRHRGQFLRELRWTVPLFLLPLALYLYLPLAALRDPPTDWGDPRTWDNFLMHVTGQQYRRAMFTMSGAQLLQRVKEYSGIGLQGLPGHLPAQFTAPLLCLAPIGLWSLARHRRRLLALTLLVYLVTLGYAFNYYIYDVEVYYLPAHLMVAVWVAAGLRQVGVWLGKLWRRIAVKPAQRRALNVVVGTSLLVMPLSLLLSNWETNDHHDDWSALMYARAALATLKPNALLLSGDDNYYFPLMYTKFVENRRPDVILMSFYDLIRPERARLATRQAARGLIVKLPPKFGVLPKGVTEDNRLLEQILTDNVGRRPVYVLAKPGALELPWLKEVINPYYRVVDSNVPSMEISRRSPQLAARDPRPERPTRARFGLRQPDGQVESGVELLGYDVQSRRQENIPWLRISYYWRVHNQALARPAKVWVLFTDAEGNYQKKADGSPEFHNIHPLAYGMGLGAKPLPPVLKETFDLYIPPQQWNQRLHMRIALALGEKFLPTSKSKDHWVELGEVPAPGTSGRPVRVAAKE